MTIKDAIIQRIEMLVASETQVNVRYKFDNLANLHFIEISPERLLNSEMVQQWEVDTFSYLFENYPSEEICFISDKDETIHIDNPDYQKINQFYFILPSANSYSTTIYFTQTAESRSFGNVTRTRNNGYTMAELPLVA